MERKRKIHGRILKLIEIISAITFMTGCSKDYISQYPVSIILDSGHFTSKSADPDETKVTDISIMVFDEYGRAESTSWFNSNPPARYDLTLTSGKKYRFVACVNFGYRINVTHASELQDIKYYMVYPDEYKAGIPMYADTGYIRIKNGLQVKMKLTRLMSKISIRMDRSRLSKDVQMTVAGIRIGNCPKVVNVFAENTVRSTDDCFQVGFSKTGNGCDALNQMESTGISYPVSLYMLENIQGKFSDNPILSDSDKVFDIYDPRRETCSYIEVDIFYLSPQTASTTDYLKYRFYLGEGLNDLNVLRNCHYQITISPEDDGLKDNGWRVDKEGLTYSQPTYFSFYPDSYIRGNIGDKIHIGCTFTPSDAPFDVGLEYMENDKKSGIYDYVLDNDGHGAVLTLTGPGSGLIYMSAGPPVNESALWFIEVNLPQDGS